MWAGSFDEVLRLIFGEYQNVIDEDEIYVLRSNSQFKAMKQVQNQAKRTLLRELSDRTLFSSEELENFYTKFHQVFPLHSEDTNYMTFDHLCKLLNIYAPFWRDKTEFLKLIFKKWDANQDGLVDVVDIAAGFSTIVKGSFNEQLRCSLSFFSSFYIPAINPFKQSV